MVRVDVASARDDLENLMAMVRNNEIVTITSENGNAVLVSDEEWVSCLETIHVTSNPDFTKNLKEARETPISERERWN